MYVDFRLPVVIIAAKIGIEIFKLLEVNFRFLVTAI
jgi:hypothetical protein